MLNIHREVEITVDEVIEACAPAGGRKRDHCLYWEFLFQNYC
jgi:hypothetical protein